MPEVDLEPVLGTDILLLKDEYRPGAIGQRSRMSYKLIDAVTGEVFDRTGAVKDAAAYEEAKAKQLAFAVLAWKKWKTASTAPARRLFVSYEEFRDHRRDDGGGRKEAKGGRKSGGDRGCGATGMDVEVSVPPTLRATGVDALVVPAGPSSENLVDLTAMAEKPAAFIKNLAKHLFAIQKAGARARKPYGHRSSNAARQGVDVLVEDMILLLCSETPADYFRERLGWGGTFAKDVNLVATISRLCEKDANFKGALRGSEAVQSALRDPSSLKLHFSADDMLALRFDLKHCSMEGVKRLRRALVRVKLGQVTVAQIKHIYNRRDELFLECGVAVTALDPGDVSGNGQCRVADVGAFLRKMFEHPKLKKTFTREIFDYSTGTAVPVYFVLVDFDGANMTQLQGMVLGFMRTLNQGDLIDDPYMQQLVMAMQGTESRKSLKGPIRNIVDALVKLEATGIMVHGVLEFSIHPLPQASPSAATLGMPRSPGS